MKTKRVRVRMPSTGGDYWTAGDMLGGDDETVTVGNIAGFPEDLVVGIPRHRVVRKRSGKRGKRTRGGSS